MPTTGTIIENLRSAIRINLGAAVQGKTMLPTQAGPHIRDGFNLTRAMRYMMVALAPIVFMAFYNTGYQANLKIAISKIESAYGWRGTVLDGLGIGYDLGSFWAVIMHGALYFVPVLIVTLVIAGFWETLFARMRNREIGPDTLIVVLLFALSLPPTLQLWQVALGITFAVVIGRGIFGGTGKYFINPVLAGLAFLYVTFPREMTSEATWTVIDAFTNPTYLELAARKGPESIAWLPTSWLQTFMGLTPGAFGVTSTLACILGGVFLLYTRVISGRVILGILIAMLVTSLFIGQFENPENAFIDLSPHWHLTLGSFAFGTVFLATDPTSAAMTKQGRFIYGLLIGFMVVIIRVMNSGHPDGIVFAILFGNIFAPLIDYLVMWVNIRRRIRRGR